MNKSAKEKVSEELSEVADLLTESLNKKLKRDKLKYIVLILSLVVVVLPATWYFTKPDCNIKGNLDTNEKGKLYYYLPIDRHYERVKINDNNVDRYFCSEEEAIKAGFTRKHPPKSLESLSK